MLVSGSRNKHRWVVPGGGIEPTEDEGVAALREVQEEAGVKGKLGRHLGVFEVSTLAAVQDRVLSTSLLGGVELSVSGMQHADRGHIVSSWCYANVHFAQQMTILCVALSV